MGLNSQRYSKVNIVSNDYARYGTSVYQKLYSKKEGDNGVNTHPYRRSGDTSGGCRPEVSSGSATRDENPLVKTTTLGSTATSATGGASLADDGKSMDVSSMVDVAADNSSKRLKIRKYRSLITTSSKKLINRLHEHGSSDTFSIFSLRTSQSHKHEVTKSEPTIFELRTPPTAKFESLPVEIVANVLFMLGNDSQRDLVNCLYVSHTFYHATKMVLYRDPQFTSTYRVAQFVTSVRLHPENGKYVRNLDLSQLRNGLITEGTEEDAANGTGTTQSFHDPEDANYQFALAGWRDWRYRHDSLYGAAALNSYNLKKVVSRGSSVSSQGTSSGISSGNVANGHCSTASSPPHPRGHRSNSSVSSLTSSIMSSLQNNSHLSLVSTSSTANDAHSSSLTRSGIASGLTRRNTADGKVLQSNQRSKVDDESTLRDSLWLRFRRGSRYKKLSKAKRAAELNNTLTKEITELPHRNTTVKFDVSPPFKTCHPYANKFLLKYAPYRDLPMGYILHLLKLCPNITKLDLSHLVFCPDFEIIAKKPSKIMNCTSLLPAVQESVTSVTKSEANLEVVYLTDTNKNYDHYAEASKSKSSSFHQNASNFLTAGSGTDDNPLPLDGQYRRRSASRQLGTNDVQLRKISPAEVFDFLCENQVDLSLESVKMDGIVWCRESMIKYFVLHTFQQKSGKQIRCSFDKAGLNKNLAWTCGGELNDFVSLLVMDHISHMDDISLRDVFNVFSQSADKDRQRFEVAKDPEILEISNVFTIEYGLDGQQKQSIDFRVTLLRSDKPTSYRVRHILPDHVSLVVNLQLQENVVHQLDELKTSESTQRLHRLTYNVNSRLCELRNSDLRRNLGENNFFMESPL